MEKRYSDFEKLHGKLRKKFADLMEDLVFPGKLLIGNFTDETIAKRSRAFEQYLTHLFTIDAIRFSEDWKHFFCGDDLHEGFRALEAELYSDALRLFEKCLPIQEKLLCDQHPEVIHTLCALLICNHKTEQNSASLKFSESALKCMQDNYDDVLYLPVLQQCIYLHWLLGKDKGHLEAKLSEMSGKGYRTEAVVDLRAVVINQHKSKSVWYYDK